VTKTAIAMTAVVKVARVAETVAIAEENIVAVHHPMKVETLLKMKEYNTAFVVEKNIVMKAKNKN
jgi:hypothetical protein